MTVYKVFSKFKDGTRNIMAVKVSPNAEKRDYSTEDKSLPFLCWKQLELSQIRRGGLGLTLASNLLSVNVTFTFSAKPADTLQWTWARQ